MSKIIYFEQHRPVLLTRVTDADLFLDAYVDSDGQKYIAMPSAHGLSFIPLFEDDAQICRITGTGGWCDGITEAITLEATRRTIRCIRSAGGRAADPLGRSFVYINCPNCNKRLIQTRVSVKKPVAYTVDQAHPADKAELTIKCERCKSIVAIAK